MYIYIYILVYASGSHGVPMGPVPPRAGDTTPGHGVCAAVRQTLSLHV